MRTLVIDTATKACSIALYDNRQIVAAAHEVIGRGHAERLLPLISALPGRGKADQIYVDVGPGSFTGIRVGVAAAKALGFAWQVPVYGFSCLPLIAAMARSEIGSDVAVDVMMTGGHGEYYFEAFSGNGSSTAAYASLKPEHAFASLSATYIAGDVDPTSADKIWCELLPDASQWHLISDIAALPASPVYGRAPDAKPANIAA